MIYFSVDSPKDSFRFGQGIGNLTIQVGSTAYLHCPVSGLGEREVSSVTNLLGGFTVSAIFYIFFQWDNILAIIFRNYIKCLFF